MDPMATLLAKAEDAGRQGSSWAHWTASDETQDSLNTIERPDVEACEAAFQRGERAHRKASGWREFWTTAPEVYDMFGTETIEACGDYCGKALRRILIDPSYGTCQTDRYWSGLYPSWEEDPRVADERALRLGALPTASETELEDEDVKQENARRATAKAETVRSEEWERCSALVPEGATLIDDGAPSQRGQWGTIPGRDPHVYYNVRIVKGWPDDADHANVMGEGNDNAGSLAYVADWIKNGRLRIATEAIPPRPVLERIGQEQRKEIRRVDVDGRVVWVGRPRFGAERLVLDEQGHLVRSKKIRDRALGVSQ